MVNLVNLILLDLNDNPWDSPRYNGDEIPELLTYLKGTYKDLLKIIIVIVLGKKDAPHKLRPGTMSKELRRTATRKKLEEVAKQLKNATASDFVVVDSHKKLYHLKGMMTQVH